MQMVTWLCFVGLLSVSIDGLSTLEERVAALENQLAAQNQALRHATEEDQIAFSVVSHQQFGPVAADTNIPFEVIHTNIGGAWHTQTNAFQAPRSGAYLFTASVLGNNNGNIARAAIVHTTTYGSVNTASLYSHGSESIADANSVILEMEVGDFVSVQLRELGSGTLYSTSDQVFSTFSGFFLFPI